MADDDLYAVLGVLPDAEDVVITAAYRALAQRYHPDRWAGDPTEAHRRMSAINHAYSVLGDRNRRAEYDEASKESCQAQFSEGESEEQDKAFASALSRMEVRWDTACSIYPDLKQHRARLARFSTSLAFAYVTALLETKAFAQCVEMASRLERTFLERYFGTNPRLVEYAASLVLAGHRSAAKALNHLVDVMGSGVDPSLLITRIEKDFGISSTPERERKARLIKSVQTDGYYTDAQVLAKQLGYVVEEVGGGLFSLSEIFVTTPLKQKIRFKNGAAFVEWVQKSLCPTA